MMRHLRGLAETFRSMEERLLNIEEVLGRLQAKVDRLPSKRFMLAAIVGGQALAAAFALFWA